MPFHLLQNLIDRLKDIFKEEMPPEIFIKDGAVLDKAPDKIWKEKTIDAAVLKQYSYDDTPPLEPDGTETEFVNTKRRPGLPHYKKAELNRKKTAISPGRPKTMEASGKQKICHNCRRIRDFNCQCKKIHTDSGRGSGGAGQNQEVQETGNAGGRIHKHDL